MASKCSFTTCKLRFFGHFCLVLAASPTFFNGPLIMPENILTPSYGTWRERLADLMESPGITRLVTGLIILNAAILGMETSPSLMADWGSQLLALDKLILGLFILELALRFVARGAGLLRDPWAVFDCLVVGIALVPASGPFAVLRALRGLRSEEHTSELQSQSNLVFS